MNRFTKIPKWFLIPVLFIIALIALGLVQRAIMSARAISIAQELGDIPGMHVQRFNYCFFGNCEYHVYFRTADNTDALTKRLRSSTLKGIPDTSPVTPDNRDSSSIYALNFYSGQDRLRLDGQVVAVDPELIRSTGLKSSIWRMRGDRNHRVSVTLYEVSQVPGRFSIEDQPLADNLAVVVVRYALLTEY
ncbi:MAG: hypothetical protein HC853_12570 [Anaerolineae bacterium]|nr:hypothetical protein [Anaerolineae bacterium]